jgi:hypothetical protein
MLLNVRTVAIEGSFDCMATSFTSNNNRLLLLPTYPIDHPMTYNRATRGIDLFEVGCLHSVGGGEHLRAALRIPDRLTHAHVHVSANTHVRAHTCIGWYMSPFVGATGCVTVRTTGDRW